MSYNSDIDFAKLALIFNFTTRDKILDSLKEVSVLEALGLNKRLSHVLYERKFLGKEQIQSILWILLCKKRIKRFPSRIVYNFTDEDDEKFLEKVGVPFQQILEEFRQKNKKLKIKQISSTFPLSDLLTGIDIQKQLLSYGLPRTLLSVLSSKGYLKATHHGYVEKIEEKRMALASPIDIQNPQNISLWESLLFMSLLTLENQDLQEKITSLFELWKILKDTGNLDIRFSEVLFYSNCVDKNLLRKAGVALYTLTQIDQIPRMNLLEIHSETKEEIQEFIQQKDILNTSEIEQQQLIEKGLVKLSLENLILHKGLMNKKLVGDSNLYSAWDKQKRKKIAKEFIPFSVNTLEKELRAQYKTQRRLFLKSASAKIGSFVQEWSQTQVMPFSPTEDFLINPTVAKANEKITKGTEYISLQAPGDILKKVDNTQYIPLDATQEEINYIGNKLGKSIRKVKPIKSIFGLVLLLSFSIGNTCALPLFSTNIMNILFLFLSFSMVGIFAGKFYDKENIRLNMSFGLLLYILSSSALFYTENVNIHYAMRFFQGFGILQVGLGILYCILRWFSTMERGKGVAIFSIFTILGVMSGYLGYLYINKIDKSLIDYVFFLPISAILLLSISIKYIDLPQILNEETSNKERIPFLQLPYIALTLFAFSLVYFIHLFDLESSVITWGTPPFYLFIIFIFGMIMGVCLLTAKTTSIVLHLRTVSFFLILTTFVVPFFITNEHIQWIVFFLGFFCGGLLSLGILWVLDKEDDGFLGETLGITGAYLGLGFILGSSHKIIYYVCDVPKIFLFITLLFIMFFYITLITPTKEITSVEETRLGGLLSLLKR